jgi:cytochrome c oxidase subunit 2
VGRIEFAQSELEDSNKVNGKLVKRFVGSGVLTAVLATMCGGAAADELNMRVGVTPISESVYGLHMYILYICCAIGVVVFGAMAYSLYHHRKSMGQTPAKFHENTRLEILWTIVPTIILVAIAVPATNTLVQMYDTGGEDMLVEVRGYQWKWQYKYLDESKNSRLSFFSSLTTPQDEIQGRTVKGEHYLLEVDNPLVVPTGKKVRLLVTSNDVIHAWWVPDFGVKRDAVPGILNDIWLVVDKPGVYRGQCTELCGKDHGFMPVVVNAVPQAEYDAWYAEQSTAYAEREAMASKTFTPDELMQMGEAVYGKTCVTCHQANGQGIPPVFPALAGGAITTGPRDAHIGIVYGGKAGTAMQAFAAQLNAAEIAAVIHYERHSWGNNAGDVTQPVDVLNWASAQQ